MSAETSVTVVGAGATGGYLVAQLAKAGVSVTLVARADSLRQIRMRSSIGRTSCCSA